MVCKIIPGTSFRRAVNYNENKVADGEASFLMASGYPLDDDQLRFNEKLGVLEKRGALNHHMEKKVQHIILAFSPSEELSDETMKEITGEYMQAIGFGDQPYLVYRHHDTAHPHLHIVTTHVQEDSTPINTFRIGKYRSNPARIALEEKYGLVRAQDQKHLEEYLPSAIDIEAVIHGKTPVKATVSRTVRMVVKDYHFTSLPELNAILKQFNIVADRGAEDTEMYRNKGLIYSVINKKGEKISKPVKASSIFSKPTLPKLEACFEKNAKVKLPDEKAHLRKLIDAALSQADGDQQKFIKLLADKAIYTLFRENAEGRIYGVTFVDNHKKCVFNGRDIDKAYSAQALLDRLSSGNKMEVLYNKAFVKDTLDHTDYTKGFETVITSWLQSGMLVDCRKSVTGEPLYRFGYALSDPASYVLAVKKMALYFLANAFTPHRAAWLYNRMQEEYRSNAAHELLQMPVDIISGIIREMMKVNPGESDTLDSHWQRSASKKKRRRRRY